jgi:anti-sigma regulatory factor (Ser/Thr protein kinase)
MVPSLELRPEPASPGLARAFVRQLLADWGVEAGIADDAELLVTELVTNAVVHARTSVHVEIHRDGDRLRFAVSDGSSRQVQLRIPSPEAVTGRGIYLLDLLSPGWGVVTTAGGKTVRFSLPANAEADFRVDA